MPYHYPVRRYVTALLLTCLLSLDGCYISPATEPGADRRETYRPIYSTYDRVRTVETLDPQPIRTAGKIYIKDQFLFINDVGRGIHIVDNSDPASPTKVSFVAIPGARELAIKDSILYVDNIIDLVALNITNPRNVRLAKRVENAFTYAAYPPMHNVRFECPDPEKGLVIGWERAEVTDPQCFR
ncbi:hypothetical protein BN8_00935 [Fibrisoma limi BUZ 3]|uniref:LVIVD repeat-containing protein n=1 Tax=Fibrisoma limi BUZ 3 TaxID=1185876 RepID=I2GDK0_9BACT|nr:hypothetical protein [Fibrisoma limi]CCH51974.1 hypothetical protein BN8_00935 [Fibrisoma limi BUZ 3]